MSAFAWWTRRVGFAAAMLMALTATTEARSHAAGFKPKDVVVAIGGKPVTDLHHFHDLLQQHKIGEPVDVTVWRNGETLTLRPVPEEYR
jgi:S1-C subfamily serine protease